MALMVDIEKSLGLFDLRVQMEADDGVTALLGASGSGKSMTLKCIAGLVQPDRGKIILNGVTFFDSERHINLSPKERRCGLMFQNYALFPHMTVRKNIYTGTIRDWDRKHRDEKVDQIMERFGLTGLQDHLPRQISGGQQQRVALARILVSEPDILMLDEPFSALDSHLRFRMEQEVRQVIQGFGKTVLLVSHDRDEVYRLSDRIVVMYKGKVETAGTREEVFARPQTLQACMLTGCKNISPIRKLDERHLLALDWGLQLETREDIGDATHIGIRHHYTNGAGDCNTCWCKVSQVIENPFTYTVMLQLDQEVESAGSQTDECCPDGSRTGGCRTGGTQTGGCQAGGCQAGGCQTGGCQTGGCQAVNGGAFGWELNKEEWRQIRSTLDPSEHPRVQIHIPPESILLLRE